MTDDKLVEDVARAIKRSIITGMGRQWFEPDEIERDINDGWRMCIPEARAAISCVLERVHAWQPIETMKDAGKYLLLTKHGAIEMDFDPEEGTGEAYYWQHLGPWYATHWMPLPAPPQVSGGDGEK